MPSYTAEWVLPMIGEPLRRGSVVVGDGRINAVEDAVVEGAIDLGAVAIMPALVNAHTHLELSYLRGRVPPMLTLDRPYKLKSMCTRSSGSTHPLSGQSRKSKETCR